MTHPYDGSSIDLERELVRYMAERRITRRQLLERMAAIGVTAALAPVVAACTGSGASSSPSAASPSSAAATTAPSSGPTASAEPTPVPSPESELYIYNYAEYMDPEIIKQFEEAHGVKVTETYFDSYDVMYPKILAGNSGFDLTFPTDTDVPGLVEQGLVLPLDRSLIPNVTNLAAEWLHPAYDPDHTHSMPYMWWTTGFAYDSKKIDEAPTSWAALWDPRFAKHIMMLDDQREVFAAALIRQGKSINTVDDAELDAALALLKEQRPLVRKYSGDPIGDLKSGNMWLGHDWSGDIWAVQETRPSMTFVLPEEGAVRGSDAAVVLQGAPHPVAANLFINHLLDAKVSAANTNTVYYMGPNAAAKEFINPDILADPALNPDQATLEGLQELLDPGADLEKYASRYQELRAGG
jgi:spermidine/putrescine transport system substrate-binding protein